jgi:tRNA (guanosine-2'-O-)-methyltransferase
MISQKKSLRKKANKTSILRSKTLICVIENPKNISNLMGIIRSAEALAVGKIYLINNKLKLPDDWNEMRSNSKFLKLSASGIKWIFVKQFSSTTECLQHLTKKNFINVGTSSHIQKKKSVALFEGKYTQSHLAIWFGNETIGLSKEAFDACDFIIKIPMYGIIESMNLNSSASIVLQHIVEKRQEYSQKKIAKKLK